MAAEDRMDRFQPEDVTACANQWQAYKRQFEIHLDAIGLHDAAGRRKVGQLLRCMGREHIVTYDSFTFLPRVPAVAADDAHGIEARAEVPAEDKYDLHTVFAKFDIHFGVHRYRSIKRQEFLSSTRAANQSVLSFISDLKRKAQYCDYGDREESLIVDMLINRVNDPKCTEKLMELPDEELTLANATRICRQVELTTAHLKALNDVNHEADVHQMHKADVHRTYRGCSRGRARGSRRQKEHYHNQECNRCCQMKIIRMISQ